MSPIIRVLAILVLLYGLALAAALDGSLRLLVSAGERALQSAVAMTGGTRHDR